MNTQHTPGRITADNLLDASGHATLRLYDGSECGDTDAQPIATVYDARYVDLLASAPDLLEALQSCQMALLGYVHHNEVTKRALEVAFAAIAKATGTASGSEVGK